MFRTDVSVSCEDNREFNQRQAKDFAISLTEKIEKTAEIVNKNVIDARNKIKIKYDKKNSSHEIKVGDNVMLWSPYFKKNIPRSFQPRWKGPWVVTRLYDKTNGAIQNDLGELKYVHLSKPIKPIGSRNIYCAKSNIVHEDKKLYTSFDDFCGEDIHSDNSDSNHSDEQGNEIVNHGWCNIDESNILPQRTRNL